MELVAQGLANIAAPIFGGITATGTIARTATNVRSGAHGPMAGIFHAGYIALFMAVAAPLAGYIPLAALAGILVVVAWAMVERAAFMSLLSNSRGDATVLVSTFMLVIFVDLPTGITVGVVLGCLIFMHRMAQAIDIQTHRHADDDRETEYAVAPGIIIHRISGAFFFGAASAVLTALERINEVPKAYVLDFAQVSFVDSSGAHALHGFARKARKQGVPVVLTGTTPALRRELTRNGVKKPDVRFGKTVEAGIAAIKSGHDFDQDGE
jgi:sulfate permease, SulP family